MVSRSKFYLPPILLSFLFSLTFSLPGQAEESLTTSTPFHQLQMTVIKNPSIKNLSSSLVKEDLNLFQVSGQVLLGNNECEAKGVEVAFSTLQIKKITHFIIFKKLPEDHSQRVCPRNYAPVFHEFSQNLLAQTATVILHNVESLGTQKDLQSLLAPPSMLTFR